MKQIFDDLSMNCSKLTTNTYSTSFSLGIKFLDKRFHDHIYGIYGFVRFADEIVDSFLGFKQAELLGEFKEETWKAIANKISLNPILNSFQAVVNRYGIEFALIETFFESMETDLDQKSHSQESYDKYIVGSAEVVGLMCLRVFTENDNALYDKLKQPAMKLGSAFQKVNFLRDIDADYNMLGRTYFPGVDFTSFSFAEKEKIQHDIEIDFEEALKGIRTLPASSRRGVYLAYFYYRKLFLMIKSTPAERILNVRIRIPNHKKFGLMCQSIIRHQLNFL
jgi:phytoene synthase